MASYYWDCIDKPHLVLCNTSKEKLHQLIEKLRYKEIPFSLFEEPDIGNEITAIATIPLSGDRRKMFSNFKLLKTEEVA